MISPHLKINHYLMLNHYPLWVSINHHRTHKNKTMTLKGHTYLKHILTDNSYERIIMKSTQGGISECLIIIAWSFAKDGKVVFYVLPTDGLKNRFVSNRWEKSMLFSSFYRSVKAEGKSGTFNLKKKDYVDNKSLKDVGLGVINFAGSQSDVPFIEIPADVFIVDEADKCDANRLEMGLERLGHADNPYKIYVGNPTFIGSFVDNKFNESTKSFWNIKAHCGHDVELDFFKHVVRQVDENDYIIRDKDFEFDSGVDINPICDRCEKPFDRFGYGEYVATQESNISGKHVSRLFSGTSTILEIVNNFSKAQGNDYKMQRFWNSDLGKPYTAEGSKISLRLIKENISQYLMPSSSTGPCVMGIDTGNDLHIRINKLLGDGKKQAVYIGKVYELEELVSLRNIYNVKAAVIDGLPEIRLSRKFSHSHLGSFRCFFGGEKNDAINVREKTVTISRLSSIDEMKEQIVSGNILYPKNILSMDEYMSHIQEPTRVWDEEKEAYFWISNKADHYFLAETYCNLAEKILKLIS